MKIIKTINILDLSKLNQFIISEKKDFYLFSKLGWNYKAIQNHFNKENNYSIGCLYKNKICGILIGEKILNDKNYDLEIHLMFVSKKFRRGNIGTDILNYVIVNKDYNRISKFFLEVSENNIEAIKFYEKNNFVFYKFRHNYYKHNNKIRNAKCYSKII